MKNMQGQHQVKKGEETRRKVEAYVLANPEALRQDVCAALGITRVTLRKHLKALWLND